MAGTQHLQSELQHLPQPETSAPVRASLFSVYGRDEVKHINSNQTFRKMLLGSVWPATANVSGIPQKQIQLTHRRGIILSTL